MAKKKNKDKEIGKLLEGIAITATISCSKCDLEDELYADEYEAGKDFYEDGWRGTEINIYCPKCSNKYLKSK